MLVIFKSLTPQFKENSEKHDIKSTKINHQCDPADHEFSNQSLLP